MTGRVIENGTAAPADLQPWPNNSNEHGRQQLDVLKGSIKQYGFTRPILVDEHNTILAGHGAWQCAVELELDEVPTRIMSGLTEDEKRAYVLIDNRTAELSNWDKALLALEVEALAEANFDTTLLGWSDAEIDIMSGNVPAGEFPELSDTESPSHSQMSLILHSTQVDTVKAAIALAKKDGHGESKLNQNGNGNAIDYICAQYLAQHGEGKQGS